MVTIHKASLVSERSQRRPRQQQQRHWDGATGRFVAAQGRLSGGSCQECASSRQQSLLPAMPVSTPSVLVLLGGRAVTDIYMQREKTQASNESHFAAETASYRHILTRGKPTAGRNSACRATQGRHVSAVHQLKT